MLAAVQKLPPLVSIGLAHATDYLRALNTEAALQKCVSFRSFDDARSMHLSPNALQQLEVRSSDDLVANTKCQSICMGSRSLVPLMMQRSPLHLKQQSLPCGHRPGSLLHTYTIFSYLAPVQILRNEDGNEHGSLLGLLNRCQTTMGSRLLRTWVCTSP